MTSTDASTTPLWQHSPDQLAHTCAAELAAARAATARMGACLVEMDTRGIRDLFGYGSAATWLADVAGISRGEAFTIVNRAKNLNAGRHPDGTPEPALAPLTGAAALEGALSNANIDLITTTLRKIPVEHREFAETTLVELARVAGPRQVRECADDLLARLDPDGPQPNDDDPGPQRPTLALRERKDGWWDLAGRVDPITGRRLRGTLDPLAIPRPREEELPDLRSPAERDGDAFGEMMGRLASAPGVSRSVRTQMIVTVPLTSLQQGLAGACLDFTTTLSATEARMLACDCAITPAVLGTAGEPLDIGRSRRLITPSQRKALVLRDRGCAFPGCHRKPQYCDGHHVRAWYHGGRTDLNNLCLLCPYHHRLVHRAKWEVHIAADGLAEFIPPAFIDAQRRPRRNNLHLIPLVA